ncbi:hypothetical protein [Pseudoxanthomonas sp. GM95]|uniref:hypothetical protein n=1 Tax=Pseudoxanthomonas sp. GM95 TaxID=1881043 RepID=UPI00111464B1|nr:hypothetical protein [Pseudoxanthomonas sp. GM95]
MHSMTPRDRLRLRQILPSELRGQLLSHLVGLVRSVLSADFLNNAKAARIDLDGSYWYFAIEEAFAAAIWRASQIPRHFDQVVVGRVWMAKTNSDGLWNCGPT